MYRCFILNSGYVESATNAHVLIYNENVSFNCISEAMKQLVIDLSEEFEFDITDEYQIQTAISDLLNGDMQTHGYFLFNKGWNTLCLTDIETEEIVVCIDNAIDIITEMVLDDLSEDRFNCYANCLHIQAKEVNHKMVLK